MTKRRILGIDPGTGILGFGVVDCEIGKPIKMITGGVISTPAHTPIEIRLEEIYNGLKEIIEETKPDEVSIEKLFFSKLKKHNHQRYQNYSHNYPPACEFSIF